MKTTMKPRLNIALPITLAMTAALGASTAAAQAVDVPDRYAQQLAEQERQVAEKQQQVAEMKDRVAKMERSVTMQRREQEQRLAEARARLDAAAREVAALSGGPEVNVFHRFSPVEIQRRAMLGINIGGYGNDGPSDGVRVNGVSPGGPADEAGLRTGDVLLSINGSTLSGASSEESARKLLETMGALEPGAAANVEYRRNGKSESAVITTRQMTPPGTFAFRYVPDPPGTAPPNVVIQDLPQNFSAPLAPFFNERLGGLWSDLELVSLTPALGAYFGTDTGILVVRAPRDDTLKLEDGDVVLAIGGRKPNDPGHALQILGSYAPGEALEIDIMRHERQRTLQITVPERYSDRPRDTPAGTRSGATFVPNPEAATAAPVGI